MSVKPLTVVTKVGRLRPEGLSGSDDIFTPTWVHEDCVTLADAERYAREKVEEAIERERWPKSVPESEIVQPTENHGSFYLETQADLVLKARVDELNNSVAAIMYDYPRFQLRIERLERKIDERLVSLPAGTLAWAPLHDMVDKEVEARVGALAVSLAAHQQEIVRLKDRVKDLERSDLV